jgi:hypothetical protein
MKREMYHVRKCIAMFSSKIEENASQTSQILVSVIDSSDHLNLELSQKNGKFPRKEKPLMFRSGHVFSFGKQC